MPNFTAEKKYVYSIFAAKMAMACSAHFELQKSSSETYGWRHGLYVHFFYSLC